MKEDMTPQDKRNMAIETGFDVNSVETTEMEELRKKYQLPPTATNKEIAEAAQRGFSPQEREDDDRLAA